MEHIDNTVNNFKRMHPLEQKIIVNNPFKLMWRYMSSTKTIIPMVNSYSHMHFLEKMFAFNRYFNL